MESGSYVSSTGSGSSSVLDAEECGGLVPVSKDLRRAQCGRPRHQASIRRVGCGWGRDSMAQNRKINTTLKKEEEKEEEEKEEEQERKERKEENKKPSADRLRNA